MSLFSRIEKDYVAAYKAKDQTALTTLRLLKSALKNRQVEKRAELSDDDVLDVVAKQVKQRQESIEQYTAAGRTDLADKEAAELEVLRGYMPEQLSSEEAAALVDETVRKLDADGMKDMGRVMQAIMAEHKGRVDGKELSDLVRSRLST
jgi:hypothetical protein